MIYSDSRYIDGTLVKAWHAGKEEYHTGVTREWPLYAQSFFIYRWVETDRLDNLANFYLGNPSLWWEILDLNPEIINPANISPGTEIRIPNA